jgi:hypothetical protein
VFGGQGLAVHFVAQQGLGVEGAGSIDAYVVMIVGGAESNVIEGGFLAEIIVLDKVAEFYTAPPGDLAPAFDAFEFEGEFGFGEAAEVVDREGQGPVVKGRDLEAPGGEIVRVVDQTDPAVVADVLCSGGEGVGLCEVVGGEGMFENFVVDVEAFAQGGLDAVALYGVF